MKIVATGATSFVGSGAVKALLERGHKVYAVLRKGSVKADRLLTNGVQPENLVILEEDLGSLERLPEQIKEPCDVFLHMGWKGAGSDSRAASAVQEENAEDALKAVRAAKTLGCRRFLFTGSQAEYGIHETLMGEETECRPTSPYGTAKLKVRTEAEVLCRSLSMDYGHARIFSTYGIGDHPWSLLSSCVKTFLSGGVMEMGACTQDWNFMYIDDAGRAIAMLCEYQESLMEHGCVYNLGGPMEETGPLKNFVEIVYEMCGKQGSCVYGVRKPNAEGVVNLIPDLTKMKKVIGWEPEVRFRDGITRVIESARTS
ncbi:MAG: NAD(P)-dependent oxidoreductase [Clostridium sp.]|nr:NAD(P)-dependent oxidoreductase [Clostridium sp.]